MQNMHSERYLHQLLHHNLHEVLWGLSNWDVERMSLCEASECRCCEADALDFWSISKLEELHKSFDSYVDTISAKKHINYFLTYANNAWASSAEKTKSEGSWLHLPAFKKILKCLKH